jgi:hypothetical protein
MEIPGLFQTIAEISIGLAGFSGLIVALRRNIGPLTEIQKYRLRVLFALAFGAMFLALLPDLLASFQVPDSRIWFDSSAALFGYSLLFTWWWVGPSRKIASLAPEIFNWRAFYTMATGHVIVLLLQLAVMIGFFEARATGIFGVGLIWYLIHAAQQFVRMLFIQPKTEAGSEPEPDAD